MSGINHKGVILVIDEQLGNKERNDRIELVVEMFQKYNIPYWGCHDLKAAENSLTKLSEINLIIMDWNLKDLPSDVKMPENVNTSENIVFLRNLRKYCFAPVFILSSDSPADIISKITEKDPSLYDQKNMNRNFIFIESKEKVVKDNALFEIINKWMIENPTIYTLKTWEHSFYNAKNKTFWNLFEKNPMWPQILWNTFTKDSIDESTNIYDTINRLIIGQIDKRIFNEKYIKSAKHEPDIEEVASVIAETMYIDNNNLLGTDVQPGDIFEKDGNIYINIRPECDTIARDDYKLENIEVYLLPCEMIDGKEVKIRHKEKTGIVQRMVDFVFFGLDNKNFYRVNYKNVSVEKYHKLRRIRRLIPPHINYLQQGFAAYNSRIGLPRVPAALVDHISKG